MDHDIQNTKRTVKQTKTQDRQTDRQTEGAYFSVYNTGQAGCLKNLSVAAAVAQARTIPATQ